MFHFWSFFILFFFSHFFLYLSSSQRSLDQTCWTIQKSLVNTGSQKGPTIAVRVNPARNRSLGFSFRKNRTVGGVAGCFVKAAVTTKFAWTLTRIMTLKMDTGVESASSVLSLARATHRNLDQRGIIPSNLRSCVVQGRRSRGLRSAAWK